MIVKTVFFILLVFVVFGLGYFVFNEFVDPVGEQNRNVASNSNNLTTNSGEKLMYDSSHQAVKGVSIQYKIEGRVNSIERVSDEYKLMMQSHQGDVLDEAINFSASQLENVELFDPVSDETEEIAIDQISEGDQLEVDVFEVINSEGRQISVVRLRKFKE